MQVGGSTLELRVPPVRGPEPPGDATGSGGVSEDRPARRRRLVTLVPLAAVIVVAAVMVTRGAPAYLAIGLLLTAVTTAVSLQAGRHPRTVQAPACGLDPAQVALLVAGLAAEAPTRLAGELAVPERAGLRAANEADRYRLDDGGLPGQTVLVGTEGMLVAPQGDGEWREVAHTAGTARWAAAQLELARRTREDGRGAAPVLVWPGGGLPPPTSAVVLMARRRAGVSARWLRAIERALGAGSCAGDLRSLLGSPSIADVVAAWERAPGGLAVPLGRAPEATLDLLQDGPHALVAGTTGSGKSELLQAWVLALASRHPPRDLAFLLVDYKGGATFTQAGRIPHCVGLLTDLDPAGSRRAISALRHELRRRERVLQETGARDLSQHRAAGGRLGRLVVVVDELRALVEDDEERLADLVAVATLGRSLGVHLVLATQRPGGVVTGQLRANLTLRICLRVLESGDALDVVGSARPASFTGPGQAMLGNRAQCQLGWLPGEAARELTDVIVGAADRVRRRRRAELLHTCRPWLPPLPEAPEAGSGTGPLLLDRPEIPAHEVWLPGPGHLLVTGPPRSGRTTALGALAAHAATDASSPVGCHVLSREGWGDEGLGTVAGCDEPDLQARLLAHVAAGGDPAATVVVDDAEQVIASIDQATGPGTGTDLLGALLATRRPGRVLLGASSPHRWAPGAAHHLALGIRDAAAAAALGVARRLVEPRPLPGRGVLLSGGEQVLAQVVPAPAPRPQGRASDPGGPARLDRPAGVLRLRPLPETVTLRRLRASVREAPRREAPHTSRHELHPVRVPIGLGYAGVLDLELPDRGGLLVVGPPGSGRTNVLRLLASSCRELGLLVHQAAPGDVPELSGPGAAVDSVVFVDETEGLTAEETERLRGALRGRCVVVTTPSTLTSDFRGLVAAVRDSGRMLALGGFAPGRVRPPPGHLPPGRGLVIAAGRMEPVQVAHLPERGLPP